MAIKLIQLFFATILFGFLNGCAINQSNSKPYPDEKIQHMLGMSRDEVFARLGPPDRSVEGDYGLMYTWLATYEGYGIGAALAVVHNMNCQFHFIFNADLKVSKIDMTGDQYVCNDFIRLNKKQFGIN